MFEVFRALVGGLVVELERTEGVKHVIWPRKALGSPRRSWRASLRRWIWVTLRSLISLQPSSTLCGKKMDV